MLRALLRERRDGCLTVSRGAITRRLYLRGGMIIYGSSTERRTASARSSSPRASSPGPITRSTGSRASGNRLLGITLVVNGCITLSDLYQGVTAQVVTILDRLQKWRKGDYEFEEGREPAAGTVLLRIPLALYLADPGRSRRRPARRRRKQPVPAAPAAGARAGGAGGEEALASRGGAGPARRSAPRRRGGSSRIGEVSFMVQELRKRLGQDPHALLGVPADAAPAAVQAAYHRIAKVLAPRPAPRGLLPGTGARSRATSSARSPRPATRLLGEPRREAAGPRVAPAAAARGHAGRGGPVAALLRRRPRLARQAQLLAGRRRPAPGGAAQARATRRTASSSAWR